jgi:hypothetical protein
MANTPPRHHSFLDQHRLPWNQLPVISITLTTTPNPAEKKSAIVSPKWTKWLGLASKTTPKSLTNVFRGWVFRKTANMRSARAGAVQTLFLTCKFEPVSATMRARRPLGIGVQNAYVKCLYFVRFGVVLGAQAAPKGPPWRQFCHHFRYFLHDLGGWSLKAGSDVQF